MVALSRVFHRKPRFYGIVYLALIPIYATAYFFFPGIIGDQRSFIECLYFSTVTITTLGYGDITPLGQVGQLVTASESLLGVVFIGLFLSAIASARDNTVRAEQAKKEAETFLESQRARLNGHFNLIRPIIDRYKLSAAEITCPTDRQPELYNPDFTLNDMKDMYKPTRLLRASYLKPAIKEYFEVVEILYKEISDLIKGVDLRCFPEIEQQSLQVVSVISNFDYSGAILSALDTRAGEKSLAKFASEMLEKYDGDSQPQGTGNILDGYVLLYHQIKIVMESLSNLESAIKREVKLGE